MTKFGLMPMYLNGGLCLFYTSCAILALWLPSVLEVHVRL